MINFKTSGNGEILFDADVLSARLEDRYHKAAELLKLIAAAPDSVPLPSSNLDILARHPLAQGLWAYQQGHVSAETAEVIAVQLGQLDAAAVISLERGQPYLLQLQSLLPEAETRGESIRAVQNYRYNRQEIARAIDLFTEKLGQDYKKFISVIRTITVVEVPRMGGLPYFSGSDSNFWGAMHTTDPADDFVFAETLTHEAAHHWLLLVEEVAPLAEDCWEGNHWISPWRSDVRPIGGVIHGVFVFSCAALVLTILLRAIEVAETQRAERIERRICRLFAQVEQGIAEMQRCTAMTEVGRSVAVDARHRLESFAGYLNGAVLDEERRLCESEQKQKRQKYFG